MKPISKFEPEKDEPTIKGEGVVWARILDKRFCYEVVQESFYKGTLVIFDAKNNYKVLLEKPVSISFGARFGADMLDTNEWDEFVINWIDNAFKE